jgi:hypothetical protein
MRSHRHYSREQKISIALRLILLAVVAFAVWAVSDALAVKDWDVEYPMTNTRIRWTGAGYNGALKECDL